MSNNLVYRFRRWVVLAIALGALLYLAGSIYAGFDEVRAQFQRFEWVYFLPVLLLTSLNYSLRFVKWHYLLTRLGVDMPLREDAWNFAAGLAMVISPGKAGELLKPYVVRARTNIPMSRTIPALVTERLTDAIAMLILAGLSVSTYAAGQEQYLLIPAGAVVAGLVVLAVPALSMRIFDLLALLPGVSRIVPKLRELYAAMRTCVAPAPLVLTILLSVIAWGAECYGFMLVFAGLGVSIGLDVSVFVYAFATIAGGASGSPGGLGATEALLVEMPARLVEAVTVDQAAAAAIIIRVATLWFGVGLGALALFRVSSMLGGSISLDEPDTEQP